MSTIAENIAAIRARIDAAARLSGRTGADITLVAATKMNDAARVREAVAAGIDACGENRVQEMTEKLAEGAYTGAPLHFIGHLQTNKVRQVVGKVDLIQSVDSPELLAMIEKRAAMQDTVQDILLEVNIGQERRRPRRTAAIAGNRRRLRAHSRARIDGDPARGRNFRRKSCIFYENARAFC